MVEEEVLAIEYRHSAEDLFRFNLAHQQYYWRLVLVPLVIIAAAFPDIRDAVLRRGTPHEWWATEMTLLTCLLVAGGVFSLAWFYHRWNARQTQQEIDSTAGACRLEIAPEGLRYSDRLSDNSLRWSGVTRIRTMRGHLCFYLDSLLLYMVPLRAFASPTEAEAFLQAAQKWHAAATRNGSRNPRALEDEAPGRGLLAPEAADAPRGAGPERSEQRRLVRRVCTIVGVLLLIAALGALGSGQPASIWVGFASMGLFWLLQGWEQSGR